MSAVSPTLGHAPVGNNKSRAGQLRLPLMIGDVLLVAIGTFYFWSTGGRHLSTDIGTIWRICARAAAMAGVSAATSDTPSKSRCFGNDESAVDCDSNRKAAS